MNNILEIKDLEVSFKNKDATVFAVNDISLIVTEKEVLGIVGESGCGKSVTCKTILGLNNNPMQKGEVLFQGKNLIGITEKELNKIRGKEISMIFQNSGNALNPMVTIGKQMIEVIRLHQGFDKTKAKKEAIRMLKEMDVPDAEKKMDEYPHQQSGGINQRIVIAIALTCNPELLIADEPTASLDVTIRNQILQIFKELKKKLSIIIVSHDLAVIKEIADRIIVMYKGMIMEEGETANIFNNPLHPYTKALLASIPFLNRERIILKGEPPSSQIKPVGCPFVTRCPDVVGKICYETRPDEKKLANSVFCHIYNSSNMNVIEELLEKKRLEEVRLILKSNQEYYKPAYIELLNFCKEKALPLGRCFLSVKEVKKKLLDIMNNPSEKFNYRIQAIYELLEDENEVRPETKDLYKGIIIDKREAFTGLCKQIYLKQHTPEEYFEKLKTDKLTNAQVWKKWIYIIELEVLYGDNEEAIKIISEYCEKDAFIKEAISQIRK